MTIEIVVSHKSDIKRVCFQVTTGQSNIGGLPCMLHVEWILFILKKKYTRLNIYSKLDGVGPILITNPQPTSLITLSRI